MIATRDNFYEQLTGFSHFNHFTKISLYTPLPPDWHIAIADVQNSTDAIKQGKYKEVNALGVASIAAVLNAVKPLTIPYVFGGDGATFCIPESKKEQVSSALIAAQKMAKAQFNLTLRIGLVSMEDILKGGHKIFVGKYQPTEYYNQAMFLGSGLQYAELLVKAAESHNRFLLSNKCIKAVGDFAGFHCRWKKIPSPHEETITLLVKALGRDVATHETIYNELLTKIFEIYGQEEIHHPLRQDQLSLATSLKSLSTEAGIITAFQPRWKRWQYSLMLKLMMTTAAWLLKKNINTKYINWNRYLGYMIANTDYRKFDEMLRMVISGTVDQQNKLRDVLEQFRQNNRLVYGIHSSPNALLTCIIFNYATDHVHFLDGSNGGYALAASEMKKQLHEHENL